MNGGGVMDHMHDKRPTAIVRAPDDEDPQDWLDFVQECQELSDSGAGIQARGFQGLQNDAHLDEWCVNGVDLHLEDMGNGYSLIVTRGESQAIIRINGPCVWAQVWDVSKDAWDTAEGRDDRQGG